MAMMKKIWDEIESDKDLLILSKHATSLKGRSELDDVISEILLDTLFEVVLARWKREN